MVKRMVYCNLKQNNNDSAIYFFGMSTDDITGEVVFYANSIQPSILKQPTNGNATNITMNKLVVKYKEQFSKGIFPNKISYER